MIGSDDLINTETKNIIARDPDVKIEINNANVFSKYTQFKNLSTGTVNVSVSAILVFLLVWINKSFKSIYIKYFCD